MASSWKTSLCCPLASSWIVNKMIMNDVNNLEERSREVRLSNNNSSINSFFEVWSSLSWLLHNGEKPRFSTATPEERKSGGSSREQLGGEEEECPLCWWEATATGGSIQPGEAGAGGGVGGPARLQNPPTTTASSSSRGFLIRAGES